MAVIVERRYSTVIHPLHAVLLAGTVPLFLGAALSDAAYASTYEIQWNNFASWLIVGGLAFASIALLLAIIDLCRANRRASGARSSLKAGNTSRSYPISTHPVRELICHLQRRDAVQQRLTSAFALNRQDVRPCDRTSCQWRHEVLGRCLPT